MIKEFLCKIGIHWMDNHKSYFTDFVSGKTVYVATCSCDKDWMVDSLSPIVTFKVETSMSIERKKTKALTDIHRIELPQLKLYYIELKQIKTKRVI